MKIGRYLSGPDLDTIDECDSTGAPKSGGIGVTGVEIILAPGAKKTRADPAYYITNIVI